MRGHREVADYYNQNRRAQARSTGAGLIWYMGRDQLSPPLSNADQYALDPSRWREASSIRVMQLARRMEISSCDRVLDLGCGIGGPGREVTDETGALVCGLNISIKQLENLRRLSRERPSPYADVVNADMQRLPLASGSVDHAFSINAIYHVNDPLAVINETMRVLRPEGTFGVDDWFTTDHTTTAELATLRNNWSTGANGFHHFDEFRAAMEQAGFKIASVVDYTQEAGEFLSESRFGATYDAHIAPMLAKVFPQLYEYEGIKPEHAAMAVAQLRSDILYMGALYRQGSAVYSQIIGEKP